MKETEISYLKPEETDVKEVVDNGIVFSIDDRDIRHLKVGIMPLYGNGPVMVIRRSWSSQYSNWEEVKKFIEDVRNELQHHVGEYVG